MPSVSDFDVTWGQNSPFPIDFARGPYTVLRYRATEVVKKSFNSFNIFGRPATR